MRNRKIWTPELAIPDAQLVPGLGSLRQRLRPCGEKFNRLLLLGAGGGGISYLFRDQFTLPDMRLSRDFNGTNQYLRVLSASAGNLAFTTDEDWWGSVWVKPDTANVTDGIVGKYDNAADDGWLVEIDTSGRFQLYIDTVGFTTNTVVHTPGQWVHLFFGRDTANSEYFLWIDNSAEHTMGDTADPSANSANFEVANWETGGSTELDGQVQALCFGRGTLTETFANIRAALYNSGTPLLPSEISAAQKTAWGMSDNYGWDLGEASGDGLNSVGGSLDLTAVNAPLWNYGVPEKKAVAAAWSNTNKMSIADHADIRHDDDDLWLSAWIRPTSLASEVYAIERHTGAAVLYSIRLDATTGVARAYYTTTGTNSVATANAATLNRWNHVLVYYKGSTETISISLNGGAWVEAAGIGTFTDPGGVVTWIGSTQGAWHSPSGTAFSAIAFGKLQSVTKEALLAALRGTNGEIVYPSAFSAAQNTAWGTIFGLDLINGDYTDSVGTHDATEAGTMGFTHAQDDPQGPLDEQYPSGRTANTGTTYFGRVSDGTGRHAISGGEYLSVATGASAGGGDPRMWTEAQTRAAGVMVVGKFNALNGPQSADRFVCGWFDTNPPLWNTTFDTWGALIWNQGGSAYDYKVAGESSGSFSIDSIPFGTDYYIAVECRAAGYFFYGGTNLANMNLLYTVETGNDATLYGGASNFNSPYSLDDFEARSVTPPRPLDSDSFNRANTSAGDIGSTDGAGHPDGNGTVNAQGAWTIYQTGGTDADLKITSNRLNLVLGTGLEYVFAARDFSGTHDAVDVFISITISVTGATGWAGAVLRVTDADNYWIAECSPNGDYDLWQFTAGTPTSRATGSVTMSTATEYPFKASANGNTITAWFNDVTRISYGSASQGNTSSIHGCGFAASIGGNGADYIDSFVIYGLDGHNLSA